MGQVLLMGIILQTPGQLIVPGFLKNLITMLRQISIMTEVSPPASCSRLAIVPNLISMVTQPLIIQQQLICLELLLHKIIGLLIQGKKPELFR